MKKKLFYWLPLMLTAAMVMTTFAACGGDDDNDKGGSGGNGGGSDPVVTIDKFVPGYLNDGAGNKDLPEGTRLAGVGDEFKFYYDQAGNLSEVNAQGTYFDFSTKGITVQYEDEGSGTWTISFNNDGYVSKVTMKDDEGSTTINMNYNSNHQLANGTNTYSYTWDGGKEEGVSKLTFTYEGSVLKTATWQDTWTEVSDGKSNKYTATHTASFRGNENSNPYGQWTPNLLETALDAEESMAALGYAGCLGRASSAMTASIEVVDVAPDESWDDYKYTGTYDCSYEYNSHGALAMADGMGYSYGTFTASVKSVAETVKNVRETVKKQKTHRRMMMHCRARHAHGQQNAVKE